MLSKEGSNANNKAEVSVSRPVRAAVVAEVSKVAGLVPSGPVPVLQPRVRLRAVAVVPGLGLGPIAPGPRLVVPVVLGLSKVVVRPSVVVPV